MIKTCNRCSVNLVEGAKYCHQCGIPVLGKYAFINDKRSNALAASINEILELKKKLENSQIKKKQLSEELEDMKRGNLTITTSGDVGNFTFDNGS